ncbi:MAG: hypothetical protein PHN35_05790 [Clostridia bacterium]|nr:hypothetical protein [Clostridia bacterium]MDD4798619.1 hypothetical protein [Clostridia bacterium]
MILITVTKTKQKLRLLAAVLLLLTVLSLGLSSVYSIMVSGQGIGNFSGAPGEPMRVMGESGGEPEELPQVN